MTSKPVIKVEKISRVNEQHTHTHGVGVTKAFVDLIQELILESYNENPYAEEADPMDVLMNKNVDMKAVIDEEVENIRR